MVLFFKLTSWLPCGSGIGTLPKQVAVVVNGPVPSHHSS
jgi:hypothetical protein